MIKISIFFYGREVMRNKMRCDPQNRVEPQNIPFWILKFWYLAWLNLPRATWGCYTGDP